MNGPSRIPQRPVEMAVENAHASGDVVREEYNPMVTAPLMHVPAILARNVPAGNGTDDSRSGAGNGAGLSRAAKNQRNQAPSGAKTISNMMVADV
jgi:hypothetical protein